jgi:hypothetical protein
VRWRNLSKPQRNAMRQLRDRGPLEAPTVISARVANALWNLKLVRTARGSTLGGYIHVWSQPRPVELTDAGRKCIGVHQ